MEYVSVQDVEIPALGLGTWNLTDDQCVRTVGRALELGYRHVDTAQDYGNERECHLRRREHRSTLRE